MDGRSSRVPLGALALACTLALLVTLSGPRAWAAPGDLDPSFGNAGKLITDLGSGGQANAVAIQPDGRIVVAGTSQSEHFAVIRYLTDGTLDASFGKGGESVPDLGGIFEHAYGLALQPDGKIVVVGTTAPGGYCCQYVVARLLPNGALDAGFGNGGHVFTTLAGGLQSFGAVAIQPDGKIVAAGGGYTPFGSSFAAVRYLPDGTLDSTFGTSGAAQFSLGGNNLAGAVLLQADGKIIVVGKGGPGNDFVLVRFQADGTVDAGFGSGGKALTDFGGFDGAYGAALQPDGKIVAAGSGGNYFGLARYDRDGQLDPTFGDGGKSTLSFTGENLEEAHGLALQADGKVVVVGRMFANYVEEFAVARLDDKGKLDPTFGAGGKVMTDFGGGASAQGVALDVEGRIVVAGGAGGCSPLCGFALARYLGENPSVEVAIDIRPGAESNALNVGAHGVVPVAILSSAEFDASQVDPLSVCFGSSGDPGLRDCTLAHGGGHIEDVNGDGRGDLLLQFEVQEAGIRAADTQACLTGKTYAGPDIHGCDALRIVPTLRPSRAEAEGTTGAAVGPLALLSVGPNPGSRAQCRVRLQLSAAEPATLRVIDVSGRQVLRRDLGSLGAGVHELDLGWQGRATSSVYWIHLTQGGQSVSTKFLLLR